MVLIIPPTDNKKYRSKVGNNQYFIRRGVRYMAERWKSPKIAMENWKSHKKRTESWKNYVAGNRHIARKPEKWKRISFKIRGMQQILF